VKLQIFIETKVIEPIFCGSNICFCRTGLCGYHVDIDVGCLKTQTCGGMMLILHFIEVHQLIHKSTGGDRQTHFGM
jgi:hypothetical protein